jgi:hypothetical protein
MRSFPLSPHARIIMFAIVAYLAAFSAYTWAYLMDDAYIGFVFLENVLAGDGMRYFWNQPLVEGVTNIGWLASLAPFTLMFGSTLAAKVVGIGSVIVVMLCQYAVGLRLNSTLGGINARAAAAIPVVILLCTFDFMYFSVAGMETAFLAALLLGMALLVARNPHSLWLPVFGAFSFTVHPEAVVVLPIYWLLVARRAPARLLVRNVLIFLALLVAITVLRYLQFGMWLPNTFASKPSSLESIAQNLVHTVTGSNANLGFPLARVFILALPLGVVGGRRALRTNFATGALLIATALAGLLFAIYALPDWTASGRYFAPYLPAALLLMWLGLLTITLDTLPRVRWRVARWSLALGSVTIFALISFTVLWARLSPAWLDRYPGYVLASTPLVGPSLWMRDNLPPGSVIATRRIGALAYYSGHRVFDYKFGLTEPEVARLVARERGAFDLPTHPALAEVWQRNQPQYLLEDTEIMQSIIESAGGTSEGFTIHGIRYQVVRSFPIATGVDWTLAAAVPDAP